MPTRKRGAGRARAHPAGGASVPPAEPDQRLVALLLHAARDIDRVETAFDAELLLSTLLGSVYAAATPDRGPAQDSFLAALRAHPERSAVVDQVLAALTEPVPGAAARGDTGPGWLAELGRVRVTGTYAYGDRYGDQTTYLATYEYEHPVPGGPEHVIAVLADHNLGVAKDLLVVSPGRVVLDQIRGSVETDPEGMTWFGEMDPGAMRAAATGYLRATDTAADLPDDESLPANRALVLARLAHLPALQPSATESIPEVGVEPADFLASPDAQLAGLAGRADAHRDSIEYCLGLIVNFGRRRSGDPLRWSPAAARLFLLDWVHQYAVLDAEDQQVLPDVLAAWTSWAGRRLDLPIPAINETIAAVGRLRPEFDRLCITGERRSPAARAMADMLAAGVDPGDSAAIDAWIRDNL